MSWCWIILTIYGGLNIIIAIGCTIIFWREGYYDNSPSGDPFDYGYRTNWGRAILILVILLLAGLPIAIFGAIVLTFEG